MADVIVHVAVPVHPGDVPHVHRGPGNTLARETVSDLTGIRDMVDIPLDISGYFFYL